MERVDMEQLLQLIGTERYNKILKGMSREAKVDGFRRGKVPTGILQNMIKTPGIPQQHFFRLVIKDYFPEADPTTMDPDTLSASPDTLPGKIAAYALRGREHQIVWPNEKPSTDIDSPTTQHTIISATSNEHTEEPERITNSDTFDLDSSTTHATSGILNESKIGEERQETRLSTRYLGYVQVVTNNYNNTFYNFHPIAALDDTNHVFVLDTEAITTLFPEKGNINIYARYRNDVRLEDQFGNGGIYVLDLDESIYEKNIRNGELNKTNIKIDIATLIDTGALHYPSDFGIYATIDIPELETALRSQVPIELSGNAVFSPDNEMVMLRSNGHVAGPFSVFDEGGIQYANPLSKKKNFLFNFYNEQEADDSYIHIYYPGGAYGSLPQNCTYINTSLLTPREVDLISDDELISQFEKNLDLHAESAGGVIQSAFVGTDLPDHIAQKRRERMLTLISQQKDLDSISDQISQLIDKLIIDAAGSDSGRFEEFFTRLANTSEFLERFQRHRIITRAIDDVQKQLEEKKNALQEQQARIDELQQQIESERVGKLNEEISEKQRTLEKLKAELEELVEKLKLANSIQDMRIAYGVEEQLHQRIQEQTKGLLTAFQAGTNDVLDKVAQVVLDPLVADIVANQMKASKNTANIESGRRLFDKANAYASICSSEYSDRSLLVKTLCERVQQYRQYSYNDIVNLLICMVQGRLSVFSGAPGTGKTSICLILAHVLGLDTINKSENCKDLENRSVLIPVERGWSSKRDFIGYFNPLTKSFDKNNRGAYNALEISNQETLLEDSLSVPPMLLILDEANLSPMEYYWADFMAVCDSTVPISIDLGEDAQFTIADSLKFLATINNDHTTESLSPRLIDRAWIISLPQPETPAEISFNDQHAPVSMRNLMQTFGSIAAKDRSLDPEAESLLKTVYDFCKEKLGISVGPRTKIAIHNYCIVGEQLFDTTGTQDVSAIIAVDYAIAQRVLPKIQGNGTNYQNALKEFSKELRANNLRRSADILTRIIQNGDNNMHYYQYFV